ncbi:hypothetical protein [Nitrosarchaeum sp. AC2]|nr:hypothetical protein [Nitrosarchaeum sp. AC2]
MSRNIFGFAFELLTNVIPSESARASIVICRFIASFTRWAVPDSPK